MEEDWNPSLNKWIRNLGPYGVKKEDFVGKRLGLAERSGSWTDRDALWALFNEAVTRTRPEMLKGLYYLMALFVNEEQRDPTSLSRLSADCELVQFRKQGITQVEILAAPDSCEACKAMAGREYTVEEALGQHLLPCRDCTRKLKNSDRYTFCRCSYLPCIPSIRSM